MDEQQSHEEGRPPNLQCVGGGWAGGAGGRGRRACLLWQLLFSQHERLLGFKYSTSSEGGQCPDGYACKHLGVQDDIFLGFGRGLRTSCFVV